MYRFVALTFAVAALLAACSSTSEVDTGSPTTTGPPATIEPDPVIVPGFSEVREAIEASDDGLERVLVTFTSAIDASEVADVLDGTDSTLVEMMSELPIAIVELDNSGLDALASHPSVVAIELDSIAEPTS